MKTLNDIALDKRRQAMESSKKISKNYKIIDVPFEVKMKRAKLGTACGSFFIFISALCYLFKLSTIATGILCAGCLTLGLNRAFLKNLTKK
ncbi:MAG: hypothetical protein ACRCST_15155 [Turicibacter sp.]